MNDDGLTVLIAATGRPDLVERTLASIDQCEKPPGFRGVIVVENGTPSGIQQVVAEQRGAQYLYFERGNKSLALNFALRETSNGLVVFTDDDVRFDARLLIAYHDSFQRHGREHFYGGPLAVDYETEPPEWLLKHLVRSARGWSLHPNVEQPIANGEWFFGANWAADRELLLELGGFDENYGPGSPTGARGQEAEMQRRMQAANIGGIYVPGAIAWHFVPAERCSPQWALDRTRQTGLGVGIRLRSQHGIMLQFVWRAMYLVGWTLAVVAEKCLSLFGLRQQAFAFRRWGRKFSGARRGLRTGADQA